MPKFVRKPLVFLLMLFFSLSACQRYQTYTNTSLGFKIAHPPYWEPYDGDIDQGVGFQAKEEGDVSVWIRIFDEVSAATAIDSLQIQVDTFLEDVEPLNEVQISAHEHPKYEIASARYVVPSLNTMFSIEIYNIVIQTPERIAVIYISGDGYEPEIAAEAIINSFEFLAE